MTSANEAAPLGATPLNVTRITSLILTPPQHLSSVLQNPDIRSTAQYFLALFILAQHPRISSLHLHNGSPQHPVGYHG